jgi:hypothetical protein
MENVNRSNLYKKEITKSVGTIGIVKKPPDAWIRLPHYRASRGKAVWSNIS